MFLGMDAVFAVYINLLSPVVNFFFFSWEELIKLLAVKNLGPTILERGAKCFEPLNVSFSRHDSMYSDALYDIVGENNTRWP